MTRRLTLSVAYLGLAVVYTTATSFMPCFSKDMKIGQKSYEKTEEKFQFVPISKVEQRFDFRDGYKELGPRAPHMPVLKEWDPVEKTQVQMILAEVIDWAPGMLDLACAGEKIPVYRASTKSPGVHIVEEALAFTGPDGIYFTDGAFNSTTYVFETTVHELIHLADSSKRLAYSKEFEEFAKPYIAEVPTRKTNQRSIERQFEPPEWPRKETCFKLVEVFAEYVSMQHCFRHLPKNEAFEKFLDSKLFHPSRRDIEFAVQYRLAAHAMMAHDPRAALGPLKLCMDMDPSCLMARLHYVDAKMLLHEDFSKCSEMCAELEKQFSDLNVDARDPHCKFLLKGYTSILMKRADFAHAKVCCDKILSVAPHDEYSLVTRARILETQDKYALAISDLRQAAGYFRLPKPVLEVEQSIDAAEVQYNVGNFGDCLKLCEKALETDSSSIDALVLKCKSLDKLGQAKDARTTYISARDLMFKSIQKRLSERRRGTAQRNGAEHSYRE